MRLVLMAVLIGSIAVPAAAQELPVSITKRPVGYGGDMWVVVLTSRADVLNIRGIDFNRGACRSNLMNVSAIPQPLPFGGQIAISLMGCDPIEIRVKADQGTAVIEMPE